MPPNRPRKGMTVPGSAQHSGSLHSMRKAPFLTDEGLLQRITTLGDPLFNDSIFFLMTIFQFVGTDQIIVPSIGAGFIGGQLGQGNGFLPPCGLGVHAYGQQQIAQLQTPLAFPFPHGLFRRPQHGVRPARQRNAVPPLVFQNVQLGAALAAVVAAATGAD